MDRLQVGSHLAPDFVDSCFLGRGQPHTTPILQNARIRLGFGVPRLDALQASGYRSGTLGECTDLASQAPMHEHPEPEGKKRKHLSNLKESMLKAKPFPKLHAKAAETKGLLEPVSMAVQHFADQDPEKRGLLMSMVDVLQTSHAIDVLIDGLQGFGVSAEQGQQLEALVYKMNVGIAKLCHTFHKQALFLFNFVPKNHYLFHLAMLGRHMSPKLAWCYQGEDLMHKVKGCGPGQLQRYFSQDAWQQDPGEVCSGTLPSTVQVIATSLPAEKGSSMISKCKPATTKYRKDTSVL